MMARVQDKSDSKYPSIVLSKRFLRVYNRAIVSGLGLDISEDSQVPRRLLVATVGHVARGTALRTV
jgi:hypothetical protein